MAIFFKVVFNFFGWRFVFPEATLDQVKSSRVDRDRHRSPRTSKHTHDQGEEQGPRSLNCRQDPWVGGIACTAALIQIIKNTQAGETGRVDITSIWANISNIFLYELCTIQISNDIRIDFRIF